MNKFISLITILCFTVNAFAMPSGNASEINNLSAAFTAGAKTIISVSILNLPIETIGNLFKDINASKISSTAENKANTNNKNNDIYSTNNSTKIENTQNNSQIKIQYTGHYSSNYINNVNAAKQNCLHYMNKSELTAVFNVYIFNLAVLPKSDANNAVSLYITEPVRI